MSSDYIPRLREELLRAGAAERRRIRPARAARALRPPAVAAAVALLALAVVALTSSTGDRDEAVIERTDRDIRRTYRVVPADPEAAQRTARVVRARLAAAGIPGAAVSVTPGASLTITAPASARADVAALVEPGELAIYDWERSLVGPGGAPDEESAGGDPLAAAVTQAEAQERAAARPGGRVVHDPANRAWFALGGDPALTAADVAGGRSTAGAATREPFVTVRFDERGQVAFGELTRDIARRGTQRARDGGGGLEGYQHYAVVLDGRILAVPYVDHVEAPEGLDGSAGARIQGGLTDQAARNLAAILNTGPLPASLERPRPGDE